MRAYKLMTLTGVELCGVIPSPKKADEFLHNYRRTVLDRTGVREVYDRPSDAKLRAQNAIYHEMAQVDGSNSTIVSYNRHFFVMAYMVETTEGRYIIYHTPKHRYFIKDTE